MSALLGWDKNTDCSADLSALRQEITVHRREVIVVSTAVWWGPASVQSGLMFGSGCWHRFDGWGSQPWDSSATFSSVSRQGEADFLATPVS